MNIFVGYVLGGAAHESTRYAKCDQIKFGNLLNQKKKIRKPKQTPNLIASVGQLFHGVDVDYMMENGEVDGFPVFTSLFIHRFAFF